MWSFLCSPLFSTVICKQPIDSCVEYFVALSLHAAILQSALDDVHLALRRRSWPFLRTARATLYGRGDWRVRVIPPPFAAMAHAVILSGASGHYGRALASALAALPAGHPARPCSLALLGRAPAALAATAAAAAAADAVAASSDSAAVASAANAAATPTTGAAVDAVCGVPPPRPPAPPSRVRLTTHALDLVTATPAALTALATTAVWGMPFPAAASSVAPAAATDGVAGVPPLRPPPPVRVTLITAGGVVALPRSAASTAPVGDPVAAAVEASVAANAVAPLRLAAAVATAVRSPAAAAAAAATAGRSAPYPLSPPSLTVVAVSSLLAVAPSPLPELLPYAVGKSAAEAGFRCLAAQWAGGGGCGGGRVLNWAPGPLAGGGMRTAMRATGVDDGLPRGREVSAAASAAALMGLLARGGWASGDHVDYFDVVGERGGGGERLAIGKERVG